MKFLSRKFLVIILTAIVEVLISTGTLPPETRVVLQKLLALLGLSYVGIEGLADIVSRLRGK